MNTTAVYLGLDLGGTGAKAGAFDGAGNLLGLGHQACTPTITADGHSEIEIAEIEKAARAAVRQALGEVAAPVTALAISSQGQTFVSLDERDRPLHPAILWYDSRAAAQAEQLRQATAQLPGVLPWIEPIATAPKILWLREKYPEVMARARRYLLLPDYFAYRLTGQAVSEPNTASSTALFAEDAAGYHPGVLVAAGIREEQLAKILPCGSSVARLAPAAAAEWGLTPETLLVTGTNDQYAGALGAGNCRPGILSETSGTCLALVTLAERIAEPIPPGLFVGRFPIARYKFALAYSKTAGVVLDWFRREFCGNAGFEVLDREAAAVPIGSRGVTMLPHFDGAISPEPVPELRGVFANLTLQHTRADMYRAILEALAFCLLENIQLLNRQGMGFDVIRAIGGGAKNEFWLQMKADVTGLPVEQPMVTEAAVLGSAMLAAVGSGAFPSLADSSAALYRKRKVFAPDKDRGRAYQEPYRRYQALLKACQTACS
jgi:xylulokinase